MAFLHDGTTMFDLNTLLDASGAGWRFTCATAINARGAITGIGTVNGVSHAFLATPVK